MFLLTSSASLLEREGNSSHATKCTLNSNVKDALRVETTGSMDSVSKLLEGLSIDHAERSARRSHRRSPRVGD